MVVPGKRTVFIRDPGQREKSPGNRKSFSLGIKRAETSNGGPRETQCVYKGPRTKGKVSRQLEIVFPRHQESRNL